MRTLLSHPLMIAVLTIVASISIFSFFISSRNKAAGTETLESLDESLVRQQQRIDELELQAKLSSDPFIQEKIQRDERLQQKPGEVVLQLPVVNALPSVPEPTMPPLSTWQEWKLLLFN